MAHTHATTGSTHDVKTPTLGATTRKTGRSAILTTENVVFSTGTQNGARRPTSAASSIVKMTQSTTAATKTISASGLHVVAVPAGHEQEDDRGHERNRRARRVSRSQDDTRARSRGVEEPREHGPEVEQGEAREKGHRVHLGGAIADEVRRVQTRGECPEGHAQHGARAVGDEECERVAEESVSLSIWQGRALVHRTIRNEIERLVGDSTIWLRRTCA